MAPILLKTKLFTPPARPNLVSRPRLLRQLDGALQPGCKLILVSAPAGFGKTTLVTSWLADLSARVSWLSLDENDNLPERFFSYLVASIQAVFPLAGHQVRELLALPRPLQAEELAGSLANDLVDVPGPYILALDDFHAIHEVTIQDWLGSLIEALPPQVHFLIISRQDPRLPLNRLRARGQMVEIRPADLRFTPQETAQFLNGVMGLNLTPADAAILEERTEGWAAGLQLAALSMHGLDDVHTFIQSFSGSNRFILDYLVEQVLDRQPQPTLHFLLQTSALERMCAGLCDAVLERVENNESPATTHEYPIALPPIAQPILEELDRANLFLIPLDSERRWFRYHHLFRDLLLARLKRTQPELIFILQTRAARWFDQNDLPREAVNYALAGQDFELAVHLIEKYSRQRWAEADTEFMTQVAQVPFEVIRSHPEICLMRAWVLVIHGQVSEASRFIREVEDRFLPYLAENRLEQLTPAQKGMLGFALGARAYINEFTHQKTDIRSWMPLILASVPESNIAYRNTMEVLIGILLLREGDFAAAAPLFLSAAERDLAAGTSNAVCVAISGLAKTQIVEGRLREAARVCAYYQQKIEERGAWRFYLSGDLKGILADVWREWNDLEQAERLGRQAIQENTPWLIPHPLSRCYTTLARILLAKGDLAGAAAALDTAQQIVAKTQSPPETLTNLDETQARLWLACGELEAAGQWASACQAEIGADFSFRNEIRHLSVARVWMAQGRLEEASAVLNHLAEAAAAGGRGGYLIQILALLAAAQQQQGQTAEALKTLEKALSLAGPEGYVRVFVDEGQPLQVLLAEFRRQAGRKPDSVSKQCFDYAGRLLAAFPPERHSTEAVGRAQAAAGLVEPLTGRELEVLSLLAAGLTNQQIARKLTISLHTVKVHISNIFQKLGVTNRTGAVNRAREIGLI